MNGSVELDEISAVGFGSYRVDVRDRRNRAALELALEAGCTLIDTASNYADGRSEELIGEVLAATRRRAFVITKVGYLSPSSLRVLQAQGIGADRFVVPPGASPYSLDPDVIRALLTLSRTRLRAEGLDAVLLHNPEQLGAAGWSSDEIDAAIEAGLRTLEDEVADGRLRYVGVSSNDLPRHDAASAVTWPRLERVRDSLRKPDAFSVLEFPLNVVEREAAAADAGPSLLERTAGRLLRITNRPLNALHDGEVARLADSPSVDPQLAFGRCVDLVDRRLRATGDDHEWRHYRPMQFLRDNLTGIESPDLCDAVWRSQIQPFFDVLFGGQPPVEVEAAFDALRDAIGSATRDEMERRGRDAVEGQGAPDGGQSVARRAVEACLALGADHVLVGMRRPAYVAELAPLFDRRAAAVPAGTV